MGVFRFSNAVSDIRKIISTFKTIYSELRETRNFSHDDGRDALIRHGLVSSSGAIGEEAVRRSVKVDRSKDPLYNQHKMYSEMFRMLGWYIPGTKKTDFNFSEFGEYIFEANDSLSNNIFEFSLLHIVSPNPLTEIKGGNVLRPFPMLLRLANDLGGLITKDELILGVLNCQDDGDEAEYQETLAKIKSLRGNIKNIEREIASFLANNKIQHTTAQNYTRFPVAAIKYMNWFTAETNKSLYNKTITSTFRLTEVGKAQNTFLQSCVDLRYVDIESYDDKTKLNFILMMVYVNFERIGYEANQSQLDKLQVLCAQIFKDFNIVDRKKIIFSPIQECPSTELAIAFRLDEEA